MSDFFLFLATSSLAGAHCVTDVVCLLAEQKSDNYDGCTRLSSVPRIVVSGVASETT